MSEGDVLVLKHRDEVHRIYGPSALLGRSKACDLSFDFTGISRRHCELVLTDGLLLVRDLGSAHGTYVDGLRVQGESRAGEGSMIRLTQRGPEIKVMRAKSGGATVHAPEPPTVPVRKEPPAAGGHTQIAKKRPTPLPEPKTRVAGSPPSATHSVAAPAPSRGSGLGKGLVLGLLLGAIVGLAVITYVPAVDPLLASLRDALGL